ncbi:MAG: SPOR domain-containing protein, partial [Candidatus Glassbacteria bacterium]|nr:SPOR domain-containing protein [Candidatus Glassbacteria bacterium]
IEEAEPEPAEAEAAPAGEEAPEAEAAPELDLEELEPIEEAEPEPAEAEAGPAGEEALEDEAAPELDVEELEPAGEAEPEPAEAEAEEPVEAEDEDSTIETLEDQDIAELEEGAEEPPTEELVELEDTGEEADEELAGEDLLGEEGDLGEDDLDIDLGTLEGEEEVKPVGRKKPKKKSKARPLVLLVIFLSLMGGMFYVWQQGIVSGLVRDHFPDLAGLLGIPTATLTEQVMSKEDERIAAEKAQKAEELAQQEIEKRKYPMLSYSIQLGSFRFMDLANRARDQLAEKGLKDAYVVPLQLDSLGDWNRLYLGFYSSEATADTARARAAKTLGKFAGSAIVRQTPYALLVGEYSSAEAADSERRRLAESNIPSYSVPIRPDPSASSRYRLFVGAFENMDQAIIMRTLLFNLGLNAEITERRGGVKEAGPPAA